MAITPINLGTSPNDGTGDNLREAGQKINDNFNDVHGRLPLFITVILDSGSWSANQQTVTATGVTATNNITVSPEKTRTNFLAYGDAKISCIIQALDSLTFECTTVPTSNITVNIQIQ